MPSTGCAENTGRRGSPRAEKPRERLSRGRRQHVNRSRANLGPLLHVCIHSSCLALGRGESRLRRDCPDRHRCTVVRCIFRPAGLPRPALHFSTGVHICWLIPSRRQTSGTFAPFPRSTSACRSKPTICSALRRFFIREPFQAPTGARGFSHKTWVRIWGGGQVHDQRRSGLGGARAGEADGSRR